MSALKKLKVFAGIILFAMISCTDDTEKSGTFKLAFQHYVDGNPLIRDSMMYVNAAENPYEITEIMYFISRVKLYNHNGKVVELNTASPFHYINPDYPQTLTWESVGEIPEGTYDSISFIFGLRADDNISNRFVNAPESNMAWPEVLGGGYHYMMMNGFYEDAEGNKKTNNFHLGTGQVINGGDTTFIDNSFTVTPKGLPFSISWGAVTTGVLTMNIESWFDTPVVYDFNFWGGAIMQKQAAMEAACKNGKDAFTIEFN
ncbi:MAG TPA: MbnP family protein [Lentimicrobium sp.]|nr:MbnP family protein [Lentimicrobium sp.]